MLVEEVTTEKKSSKLKNSTENESAKDISSLQTEIDLLKNELGKSRIEAENLRSEKSKLEEKIEDLQVDVKNLVNDMKLKSAKVGTFDIGDNVTWPAKFGSYVFKISSKYDKPVYNIYALDLKFDNIPQDELENA